MAENKPAFLQIGLGSMGKRRSRNLFANGEKNIIGFDLSPERRKEAEEEYGIKTIDGLNKISDEAFDAVIISTPPNKHGDFIRWAIGKKKHFFVEVATSDDGYENVFENKNLNIVMAPSCTYRFFLPIKMMKEVIDSGKIGRILSFQHHMGQYLPDWHPWEDYRNVYFSKKETGACREMLPYELIWLNWLTGSQVGKISGYIGKISDLDMEADDLIAANLQYANKVVGNIMIDVISRKPFRTTRILGSEGVLEWEWLDHIIKIYDAKSKITETIDVPKGNPHTGYINAEEMYNDEIKAFLEAIYGRAPYPYTFEEDLRNLKTLYKLESGGGEI